MKITDNQATQLNIPAAAIRAIEQLIEKPKLLKSLILIQIADLEEYAKHPANEIALSNETDCYGNLITQKQDLLGRAAFYKRLVGVLDLYKPN